MTEASGTAGSPPRAETHVASFARSMGNGFPIAAATGEDEVMHNWAAGGMRAGTYSGNAIGVAAVSATIAKPATGEPFVAIEHSGTSLMNGIERILAEEGVPGHVTGPGRCSRCSFGEEAPVDFRDTAEHDHDLSADVVRGMIRRGVMPVDDALEPWFVSSAHADEDVATSLEAFGDALVETKG